MLFRSQDDETEKEAAYSVLVEPAAQIQLPCVEGVGSMADYLAIQERKRKAIGNDVASGSGTKTDRVLETDLPFIDDEEVEPGLTLFT